MPDTVTPKLNLVKPEIGASADSWGNKLNNNLDIIDTKMVRQTIQWTVTPGDDNPASSTGPFMLKRFNNAGVESGTPFQINRQTGDIAIAQSLTVGSTLAITSNASIGGNLNVTGSTLLPSLSTTTFTVTGTMSVAGTATMAAVNAASVSATGTISGNSLSAAGAISGNAITVNGVTVNGDISAVQISSNVMVANSITANSSIISNSISASGVITGNSLNVAGAITSNTITVNGATVNGNSSVTGTLSAGGISTTNISGNAVTINGLTVNGNSNVTGTASAGAFSTGGNTSTSTLGVSSNATISGNLTVNGALLGSAATINAPGFASQAGARPWIFSCDGPLQPTVTFLINGVFGSNFGMGNDGNFYFGGFSHGAVGYKLWSQRDFNYVPPAVGSVVTDGRLVLAGDSTYGSNAALQEPFTGAVVTGLGVNFGLQALQYRSRYMQLFRNNWFTVGYA